MYNQVVRWFKRTGSDHSVCTIFSGPEVMGFLTLNYKSYIFLKGIHSYGPKYTNFKISKFFHTILLSNDDFKKSKKFYLKGQSRLDILPFLSYCLKIIHNSFQHYSCNKLIIAVNLGKVLTKMSSHISRHHFRILLVKQ